MIEVTAYACSDGRWCVSLRPGPGRPIAWWSHWGRNLKALLRVARSEVRRRWPREEPGGVVVSLWDERSWQTLREQRGSEVPGDD